MCLTCSTWEDHQFKKTGTKRIPVHGSYCTNMPLMPTGTVEYEVFHCEHCGMETSQEVPYSYLPKDTAPDFLKISN